LKHKQDAVLLQLNTVAYALQVKSMWTRSNFWLNELYGRILDEWRRGGSVW